MAFGNGPTRNPQRLAAARASRDETLARADEKVPTYFRFGCSVCGRQLLIRVELLGKRVACGHCGRDFTAVDAACRAGVCPSDALLARADGLLAALRRDGEAATASGRC